MRVDRHRVYVMFLSDEVTNEFRLSANIVNDVTNDIYFSIQARAEFVQLSSVEELGKTLKLQGLTNKLQLL